MLLVIYLVIVHLFALIGVYLGINFWRNAGAILEMWAEKQELAKKEKP